MLLGTLSHEVRSASERGGSMIRVLTLMVCVFGMMGCQDTGEMVSQKSQPRTKQPAVSWGQAVQGLRLGLQCPRTALQVGETAEFTAHLKNEGSAAVHIPGFFFGLKIPGIRIHDDSGNEIGFMKENLEIELGQGKVINPGQTLSAKQTIALNEDGWEGNTGEYHAVAVFDTRQLEWGTRRSLNARPKDYWIGMCESEKVSFTVGGE